MPCYIFLSALKGSTLGSRKCGTVPETVSRTQCVRKCFVFCFFVLICFVLNREQRLDLY